MPSVPTAGEWCLESSLFGQRVKLKTRAAGKWRVAGGKGKGGGLARLLHHRQQAQDGAPGEEGQACGQNQSGFACANLCLCYIHL